LSQIRQEETWNTYPWKEKERRNDEDAETNENEEAIISWWMNVELFE